MHSFNLVVNAWLSLLYFPSLSLASRHFIDVLGVTLTFYFFNFLKDF